MMTIPNIDGNKRYLKEHNQTLQEVFTRY